MSAMDGYGHTELNVECPLLPFQRQSFGLENELMEILWQDGEAFLQSQSHRKPNEHVPWVDDNSFDYLELMSGIPPSHLPEPNKLADVEEDFRLAIFNPIQLPLPAAAVSDREQGFVTDSSVMTMDLSNGSSCPVGNEVNKSSRGKGSNAVLAEVGDNSCRKVSSRINDIGKEMTEPENASFRGSASEDDKSSKRKIRDVDESASPSEDCQMESSGGKNRSPQKSIRRSRVAEVHNLSERRRRDRINEKMRALQKLIPHSHKSDKASMLDDAIKYMKSLQSQLQWWMGNGMAQTRMLQQLYHSGIGMRPPALPSMQNLVYLSGLPLVGQAMNPMPPPFGHGFLLDPFSSQNQMPPERKSEPTGVHFVPYAQSLDAAGFSSHAAQANHVSTHPHTGNSQMNL